VKYHLLNLYIIIFQKKYKLQKNKDKNRKNGINRSSVK
jgi:hypothetical protein